MISKSQGETEVSLHFGAPEARWENYFGWRSVLDLLTRSGAPVSVRVFKRWRAGLAGGSGGRQADVAGGGELQQQSRDTHVIYSPPAEIVAGRATAKTPHTK